MRLLVHAVEEWKCGGKNEDMDGGEQAQKQNDFAFARGGRVVGGFVHFPAMIILRARSSKKLPRAKHRRLAARLAVFGP